MTTCTARLASGLATLALLSSSCASSDRRAMAPTPPEIEEDAAAPADLARRPPPVDAFTPDTSEPDVAAPAPDVATAGVPDSNAVPDGAASACAMAGASAMGRIDGLVPLPRLVQPGMGVFTLDAATRIVAGTQAAGVGRLLAERLQAATGFPIDVVATAPASGAHIALERDPAIADEEGYRLDVDSSGVHVRARTAHGLFDGVQTLRQLFPGAIEASAGAALAAPAVHIEDAPRFHYRGVMLDTSRHFFSVAFLERFIDLLALYKIDVFHWHLTDDQGWRLEIKKYPLLTKVGAYRDDGKGGKYGDFYTQDDVRAVVAYAAARFVTVVPEIEMPGHAAAALAAYPQYSCTGGPFAVRTTWGAGGDAVFCPTDATLQFLGDVLTEVAALFPGPFIHVGGDEVKVAPWMSSSDVQAVMTREKLTTMDEMRAYFTGRIAAAAKAHGRRILGWDEVLSPSLAPDAAIMSWHGGTPGKNAAVQGHDVVMSPSTNCYLDHYQAGPAGEPQAHGGALVTLQKVYGYEPLPTGLTDPQAAHVLGLQGNLWTEYVPSEKQAEYMAFPRAAAIAEVAWSTRATVDYAGFVARLQANLDHLDARCVGYAHHF